MAKTTENKEAEVEVVSNGSNANPLKVPFPQDAQGVFKDLKTGGLKSIGRAAGNAESIGKVIVSLRLLKEYAEAKHAQVAAQRAAAKENARNAALRVAQKQKQVADDKLSTLVKAAKSAKAAAEQKAAELKAFEESGK